MLLSLAIKNIALIDSLEIDFSSGLTILSGETGAGKSIIVDSINFALGARADKGLIRYGQDEATVEAEFDCNINVQVKQYLDEMEIDCADGLIISRVMTESGKNTCRINGIKVTLNSLKDITGMLVDIYGQHDASALLVPKTHLSIIDAYGRGDIATPYGDFKAAYNELKVINTALKQYGELKDVNKKMNSLKDKIAEIEAVKLKDGEEDALAARLKIIENAQELTDGINNTCEYLDGDRGACQSIKLALRELQDIEKLDISVSDDLTRLDSAMLEIEDISNSLSRVLAKLDFDEYEREKITDRLDYIRDVCSRYGGSENSTFERLAKIKLDYEYYSNSEFEVIELTKKRAVATANLYNRAVNLSNIRRAFAAKFAKEVLDELSSLGMGKTKFEVNFAGIPTADSFLNVLNSEGIDSVEFLISPNPGQPLKPLAKIISGGEMSRFMLALKKITAELDGVNVMIFDEIDTGISGNIATVVARALSDISRNKQVLAITHLPQLASYADTHYFISKVQTDTTTATSLTKLSGSGVIKELSRLIGGDDNSEHAIAHAKDMQAAANDYKAR